MIRKRFSGAALVISVGSPACDGMCTRSERLLRPSWSHRLASLLTAAAALTTITSAQAATEQVPSLRYAIGLVGGISQFDLSGTGTTGVVAVRADFNARSWFVVEGGLSLFRPQEQFGKQLSYAIPEVQIQLQLPTRGVRPYLGVGVGSILASGGPGAQRMVSGAGGLRIAVPDTRVDLRAELRVRGIGESFTGSIAEWTFGGGYRFE